MIGLAHRIALSSGWQRRIIAALAGAVGAFALAPIDFFPAMLVPMTVAVWLIDGSDQASLGRGGAKRHFWPSLRSAASSGWWWGFGYFVAGLWWLGAATLVEPDKFAWALPISVLGVPAMLAFFPALGFALARALWMPKAGRVLALAWGLGTSEWLRAQVLTGFPWNEYGMALGDNLVLAQPASLFGLHGLTLITVAIFASPALLADREELAGSPSNVWGAYRPILYAFAALLAIGAFGTWRLARGSPGNVEGVKLRIMQPNVTQNDDFTYAKKNDILRHYLTLSDKATSATTTGLADVTHLIWPESPFPFILSRDAEALDAISAALPAGTVLITGAARVEGQPGSSSPPRYYNSIEVLTKGGEVVDTYDKVHLVPFGEYVPMDAVLSRLGVHHFVHIPGGFEPGARHHLLNVPGLPSIVPAICYEAIFPGEIVPDLPAGIKPGAILNVTNDSWFGNTTGPYQHLAQARLRAIEEGLPLVRAANTGISAIVDPYGRIIAELPLGVENVLDGPLPRRINRTPFGQFHELVSFAISGLLLTTVLFSGYRSRRKSSLGGI